MPDAAKESEVILIYSGGLDSTVLLYHLIDAGFYVRCLTFDYGQRHRREIDSARDICQTRVVEHCVAKLDAERIFFGNALTDPDVEVPEGHYEDPSMKATVVPSRNAIMLSIAAAWAISTKSPLVAFAAHAGDSVIYPDCRASFVQAMSLVFQLADEYGPQVFTPFLTMSKTEVVLRGAALEVPFGLTWTCYNGASEPCGKCGACVERAEAFQQAGVEDPLG